jgi:glycosyltransferase involved in cell wall biosynthesis
MTARSTLFLFKAGRKARLDESGPREFFYGFTEMSRLGVSARLLEESDLPQPALSGFLERLATRFLDPLTGLNADTLSCLSSRKALAELNRAQALVATTNAYGLALGALKSVGLLAPPVLFLPMGVWPMQGAALRRPLLRHWLRQLSLAPISLAETAWLRTRLGPSTDIAYLPFGVDTQFWSGEEPGRGGNYVFAIGNDPHRDWSTLAAAWSSNMPPLRIVTKRPVPPSEGRIDILVGDWNSRPIADQDIRDMYRESAFVVLPIRQTIQPSGQSACLQAMACGKAVILSRIAGLWDDEAIRDGETCLLVPPGNPAALAQAVRTLSENPELAARLGRNAREIVARRFTIERMGETMAARLQAIGSKAT